MVSSSFDEISTGPYKSWTKFLLKLPAKGIKRSADFKRCKTLVFSKRKKFTEKLIFKDLDN
jgi:hypothetical protein